MVRKVTIRSHKIGCLVANALYIYICIQSLNFQYCFLFMTSEMESVNRIASYDFCITTIINTADVAITKIIPYEAKVSQGTTSKSTTTTMDSYEN